jgi:glycosyltransferase involved in cell wall biosynthesis
LNILLVTETLHTGGAETFVVRLANALQRRGHRVHVFVLYPQLSKKEIIDSLHPDVQVRLFEPPLRGLKQKLDSMLYRLGVDLSLLKQEATAAIAALIRNESIDVVHSHLFGADEIVSQIDRGSVSFRHVATHHGDYLMFEKKAPWHTRNYPSKLQRVIRSLSAMAVISEPQRRQFDAFRNQRNPNLNVLKILNGYEAGPTAVINRSALGFSETDFVFGMVARGITEKGWDVLLAAFEQAALPDARLLLVGEGPEIDRLKTVYESNPAIHFAGYSANTIGYIRLFDVGVLPSRYGGESLPTVLIEYLACGKPVIASDIGEIASMLQTPDGERAGLLLPFDGKQIQTGELADRMKALYSDPTLRNQLATAATAAFRKFDMTTCVEAYENMYSDLG